MLQSETRAQASYTRRFGLVDAALTLNSGFPNASVSRIRPVAPASAELSGLLRGREENGKIRGGSNRYRRDPTPIAPSRRPSVSPM